MTEDAKTTTTRYIERLANSERAMVPLAIIGAFLLLSSVLIVGYLETGAEPEPDVDATLALDRTEATMQSIVRDSSQRAAERAATQPLTDPAETEWGAVLDRSGERFSEDPFENYLRALVYLEVREDLELVGQEEGSVETNVTLPAVTSPEEFADAIQRVTLDGNGTEMTVSLSNVTITATHAGEVIEQRETTVEVTILAPVLQLHDKVEAYQHAIDEAGVTERGFTQRFNARTYAIGWARGWAQNYQAPVGEVLANRHIEPSANAALYRTQQDIFGAADPNLRNAVRLGWACMALKDGSAMVDEYGGLGKSVYNGSSTVGVPGEGDLCSGAHFLLDQATEQHPEPPDITDLIGGTGRLQENETVSVGKSASIPLVELMDANTGYAFENAIQRIFTIEGYVDADASVEGGLEFDLDCDLGYREGAVSRDGSYGVTTESRTPGAGERYYEYESKISVVVTAERICYERDGNETVEQHDADSYTIELTTVIGEKTDSPFAEIDKLNPLSEVSSAHKYHPGPDERGPPQFNNYDGAAEEVTEAIIGGTEREEHEQWLDDRMETSDYEEGPPEEDAFETTRVVELDYEELLGDFKLAAEMTDAVVELREAAANVSVEFERRELVTGNPTSQLLDELETELKEEYIDEPDGYQYENVREKVLYEARYVYYLSLVEQLEGLEDAHDVATNELDDRIVAADSSLDNATQFLAHGVRQQETSPGEFASSELTDDISYEISGSPTYLLSEQTVDTDRVPPVDQGTEFAPLRTKNENVFDMPYDAVIDGILSTVLSVMPGLDATPDAEITLRMAADVLTAGEMAVEAHEDAEATDRRDVYLNESGEFERDVEAFKANVEEALDTFEQRTAAQTVVGLYPSPAAECILYGDSTENERYPGKQTCAKALQEHGDIEGLVTAARWAVEDGIENALDPYETAEAARLIGDGNATEYIVDNVTRELDDSEYRGYSAFATQYDDDQWNDFVEAAVRPAVTTASATSVEIGSAEQAEALDESIQEALDKATTTAVETRIAHEAEAVGNTVGERWLGNREGTKHRAARVPAGLPLLPIPGKWVATANAWTIEVAGEYARFEVSATVGTPADGTQLNYVRENRTVNREISGTERTLGSVEEIAFDSRSVLVVVTPPGVGVGDRDGENPECSATYPHVGDVDSDQGMDCTSMADDHDQE